MTEKTDAYFRKLVEEWPPLTEKQIVKLDFLLNGIGPLPPELPSTPPRPSAPTVEHRPMHWVAEPPPAPAHNGMTVYFISDGIGNVKIGHSVRPQSRLVGLQTGSPHSLKIEKIIPPGRGPSEKDLHQRWDHYRVRGEWFRYEGDLAKFIEELPETY